MIYSRFLTASLLLAICACNSTNVKEERIGSHEIVGKVVTARTHVPVASALVILTVPQGNSWSLPTSFLVGYGYTDTDGTFRIPAQQKSVKNLRYEDASITIDAYHPDYEQSVEFIPRHQQIDSVTVKMKRKQALRTSASSCTYNNKEICNIVDNYLGIN